MNKCKYNKAHPRKGAWKNWLPVIVDNRTKWEASVMADLLGITRMQFLRSAIDSYITESERILGISTREAARMSVQARKNAGAKRKAEKSLLYWVGDNGYDSPKKSRPDSWHMAAMCRWMPPKVKPGAAGRWSSDLRTK